MAANSDNDQWLLITCLVFTFLTLWSTTLSHCSASQSQRRVEMGTGLRHLLTDVVEFVHGSQCLDNASISRISLTWSIPIYIYIYFIWQVLYLIYFSASSKLPTQDQLELSAKIGACFPCFTHFAVNFDPGIRDLDHSLWVYLVLDRFELLQPTKSAETWPNSENGIQKVTRDRTIEQVELSIWSALCCADAVTSLGSLTPLSAD